MIEFKFLEYDIDWEKRLRLELKQSLLNGSSIEEYDEIVNAYKKRYEDKHQHNIIENG